MGTETFLAKTQKSSIVYVRKQFDKKGAFYELFQQTEYGKNCIPLYMQKLKLDTTPKHFKMFDRQQQKMVGAQLWLSLQ